MKMVDENNAGWVTPEAVAEVMLGLVEKEEWVGGTIVEIGARVRKVEPFNDPGPAGGGNAVENSEEVEADMWASLEKQLGEK
jgi:3-hydroxybutyrate dehydrogenase